MHKSSVESLMADFEHSVEVKGATALEKAAITMLSSSWSPVLL
ncbi:hypothetical protein CCHL11_02574 [Colletotrichum chlorophyti]|uniref:Uncharacterized protein n=1 Tax=Colletotrichum chlorophyti TaxID=708187 RepID=A0A1Q8S8U8_9PEZI|nr:hypothetical protein CCHL11_02574 [Colletotrichum chlorophyti]